MDSKNKIISNASGGASASVSDALGNVIASSYIADVSWNSETRVLSCLGASGNVIGSVEIPPRTLVDDVTKPLMFRATANNSSVTLSKGGSYTGTYRYSYNNRDWSSYTYGTRINLNEGDCVYFKVSVFGTKSASNFCRFVMTGDIEAWHNVNSMVSSDFASLTDISGTDYAFNSLFQNCTSLKKSPLLPATVLAFHGYMSMFENTGITNAPALPATSFSKTYAYQYMFYGCSNLVQPPPRLPGKVSGYCFEGMFQNCTSLVQTPTFTISNATSGASCCLNMFNGCSSLEQINISINYGNNLNTATATNCFENMFKGCTRITQPPSMSATNKISAGIFKGMFYGCTSLAQAPTLPNATTLYNYCYQQMFQGCTSLVQAPALPATTLAQYCYSQMFQGCTNLAQAPTLPATTLQRNCYSEMFRVCANLVQAPALPATTLAQYCYSQMFYGCTSLVQAPALPATTVEFGCYSYMFHGCTSLVQAPVLPATTIPGQCYQDMFRNCSSLNAVTCRATNATSTNGTTDWLDGVAASGDFYTPQAANWSSGSSGIPDGWTRHDI